MRALVNRKAGGPDVLSVEEQPDPTPGPGEVRIAVKRAGLNFSDIAARVGIYPEAPKFPMVMGYELGGVVDQVGAGVARLKEGDRVTAMCRFGGQVSSRCVPESFARKIPDAMSFDEAAALPVNYLTAYQMLFWTAPLLPGMTVLVHMAAGGVGTSAIQLCRAVPDITILGSASASKHAFLKELGVHHCIDYRTQDFVAETKRVTDGRGADRILDALGGRNWERSLSALRSGGTVYAFGWANMVDGEKRSLLHMAKEFLSMRKWSPFELMGLNKGIIGINLGYLWHEGALMGSHLDKLIAMYERGQVKPHVDRVFPLSKGAEAHAYVQARKNLGKVVFDCEA